MLELWVSRYNTVYLVYDKVSNKHTLWLTMQQLMRVGKENFIDNYPVTKTEHTSYPLSITSIEEISSLPAIHPELFI